MKKVKKTHWFRTTLIVLICCGIAGAVLAAVLFQKENNQTSASASLQFSFNGAAEGMAPNGYPFDVNGITSDEVLDAALESAGLAGAYTADQIRGCLSVTGVYPETIAEQMTRYLSLLDGSAGTQLTLTDYYATQYSVTLYNSFDPSISSGIADLSDYDYAQQLEAVTESVNQQIRYAQEMDSLAPDFRLGGRDFGDIVVKYNNLISDMDRLNATITLNAVSKDRDRLRQRYEMEIRSQNMTLASLTEELKLIEAQVNSYAKDGIIYVSSSGRLQEVGVDQTATYDTLVKKRKTLTDTLAETNATIALYQDRLDDMTGAQSANKAEMDDEDSAAAIEQLSRQELAQLTAAVESRIAVLKEKKDAVAAEFAEMLAGYNQREINESTVFVTGLKVKTPSLLSGAFLVKIVKTAGPICVLGLMVCLVLIIISRRKEAKAIS